MVSKKLVIVIPDCARQAWRSGVWLSGNRVIPFRELSRLASNLWWLVSHVSDSIPTGEGRESRFARQCLPCVRDRAGSTLDTYQTECLQSHGVSRRFAHERNRGRHGFLWTHSCLPRP